MLLVIVKDQYDPPLVYPQPMHEINKPVEIWAQLVIEVARK